MTSSDIKIIDYKKINVKRFQHWVTFIDRRNYTDSKGKKGRINFLKYIESLFGNLGIRWCYQKDHNNMFIIKFNEESDLLIFLLKFRKD